MDNNELVKAVTDVRLKSDVQRRKLGGLYRTEPTKKTRNYMAE